MTLAFVGVAIACWTTLPQVAAIEDLAISSIALFDSEYGCAPLVKATAAIAADQLMRIRSNRCLWSTPPAYSGRGLPKIHGQQFRLNDSQSWWEPEQTLESVN